MSVFFSLFAREETAECGRTSTTSTTPLSSQATMTSTASETHTDHVEEKMGNQNPKSLGLPEGGLYGWMSVLGGAMVTFSTFGVVQSFGVFQDYYTRVRFSDYSPSHISWIGSVQVFLLFAVGLPAGKMFDKGYFRLSITCGSLLLIFSSFMLSLTKPQQYYAVFLSQGVGMGTGMGLLFLPSMTLTSHYFRLRRSIAMGVVMTGSSLGAVIHPVILNNMFKDSDGFAKGIRAISYLDLGLLVIANLIMRPRFSPRKSADRQPVYVTKILMDIEYVLFVIGTVLLFWGTFIPFFYLQLYAAVNNIPETLVTYSVAIMNISSIFGRTLPNFLADYIGPFNVLVPSAVISSGLIFALLGATNIAGVVAFAIIYGFISGGFLSMATPTAASFSTNSDLSDMGLRVGLLSFGIAFAVLTGNPIAGALLHSPHYIWWRPLTFATAVSFCGSALLILARRGVAKRKGKSRI